MPPLQQRPCVGEEGEVKKRKQDVDFMYPSERRKYESYWSKRKKSAQWKASKRAVKRGKRSKEIQEAKDDRP